MHVQVRPLHGFTCLPAADAAQAAFAQGRASPVPPPHSKPVVHHPLRSYRALVQGAQVRSRGCLMPLSSEASAAHNLRLAVVEDLRARRAELEPFVAGIAEDGPGGAAGGFGDFDAYLAHMSRRGVWGGEPELLSASTLLRAPVTVFHVQQGMLEPIVTYGEGLPGPAINVLWTGMHYDLLLEDGGGRAPGGGGGGSGGNPNDNAAAARSKGEAPRSKL